MDALVDVARELGECDPLAVLVTGSVALGTATVESDIDLYAIVPDCLPTRVFRRSLRLGADVDLWIIDAGYVRDSFWNNAGLLYCFAVGIPVLDSHGILSSLVVEAKIRYAAGPRPIDPQIAAQLRHRIVTILDDCERMARTQERPDTMLFSNSALRTILKVHCGLTRLWSHDDRVIMANLRAYSPAVAKLTERILDETTVTGRAELLRELGELVLEPHGGLLRYFQTSL
ncbi:MAG TPA: nucleotidyltransferase domain-containing protein [Candidatus Sulfotelmatobacter sp.]|nr:nucleotidyltransferase domain-containing protein [Candidatus Sulfotelmatobacter sp.]